MIMHHGENDRVGLLADQQRLGDRQYGARINNDDVKIVSEAAQHFLKIIASQRLDDGAVGATGGDEAKTSRRGGPALGGTLCVGAGEPTPHLSPSVTHQPGPAPAEPASPTSDG